MTLCAVLLVCTLAVSADAAQAAQPQNTTPAGPAPQEDATAVTDQAPGSTSVPVTLTNGFITQRLPFDVPFYVNGSAAVGSTRIDLFVYPIASRTVVSQFATSLQDTFTCTVPGAPTPVSRSTTRPNATSGAFTLLIDALDPQRYYVFCFLTRGPVATSEIEVAVRQILIDSLRAVPEQGSLGVAVARAFHDRLSARIAQLGRERAVPAVIPEGNIFHPDTVVAQGSDFALLLGNVENPWRALAPIAATAPGLAAAVAAPGFVRALAEVQAARAAALADDNAKPFLSQQILDVLPGENLTLPARELAITSASPFDISRYNVDAAAAALTAAVTAATVAKNDAAVKLLTPLLVAVRSVGGFARAYGDSYDAMRAAAQQVVNRTVLESRLVTVSLGSSVLTADLNRNAYVSLDAGIAYPWRLENMVFYAGTNIYFRPINKEAPLRYKGTFLHRFALTIGITTTVKDDSRRAIDLRPTPTDQDTSNSLLLGGGLRVTPSIRVGAGALVFKESDPNPLITQTSVTATPYVSLAADVNVAAILRSFFPSPPE